MMHGTFLQGLIRAALLGTSLGFFAKDLHGAQPPEPAEAQLPAILKAKALKPGPGDDELRKLLIARYNVAIAEMEVRLRELRAGKCLFDALADVAQRLVDSGIELSDKPTEQLTFREQFLELATEIERIQKASFDSGRTGQADLERARYLRLDAEIQVLKAKRKATAKQPK